MKARDQMPTGDGFDRNVAEKMPTIKKVEDPVPSSPVRESKPLEENGAEKIQDVKVFPQEAEKKVFFPPGEKEPAPEEQGDVLGLIEDLHSQLLVSSRTKRALEMDLASQQKTIRQLTQDNQGLRAQLDQAKKELLSYREIQSETVYLREENTDALERIQEFQQEAKRVKEALAVVTRERDEALRQIHQLESQKEQNDLLRIKERLREKEASHFSEENQELQTKLEEALAQNADLEGKYEALRRSFNEVRESLTVLRDSCKASYYKASEPAE